MLPPLSLIFGPRPIRLAFDPCRLHFRLSGSNTVDSLMVFWARGIEPEPNCFCYQPQSRPVGLGLGLDLSKIGLILDPGMFVCFSSLSALYFV
jgi:hypothetical protein